MNTKKAKQLAVDNNLELSWDPLQQLWYLQHDDYTSYAMGEYFSGPMSMVSEEELMKYIEIVEHSRGRDNLGMLESDYINK